MKKPNLRTKRAKGKNGGARPGAGRPPKRYTYDPKTIPGLRDQGRARAATSIPDMIELAERMMRVGLGVLRTLEAPAPRSAAGDGAAPAHQLAGRVTETNRDDVGDKWTNQTVEERRPYAGLEWSDVRWASDYLADRCGFSRKTETELSADTDVKLWNLGTYRAKDGTRVELPRDTPGDPQSS